MLLHSVPDELDGRKKRHKFTILLVIQDSINYVTQ